MIEDKPNDEIKEILDKMKDYSGECHSILAYSICGYKKKIRSDFKMCMNDVDKLLDYITNLQQENERLKSRIEEITKIYQNESSYRTELETKYVQLQQENKRLKILNKTAEIYIRNHTVDYIEDGIKCVKPSEYFNMLWPVEILNGDTEGIEILVEEAKKEIEGDDENEER